MEQPDAPDAPQLQPNDQPAAQPEELLVVGRLVAAQGLRGELRLLPLSDFPERFTKPGRRWLRRANQPAQAPAQAVELRSGRPLPGKDLYVVRLAGIDDRTAAENLVGHEVLVDGSQRPQLAPGEFHLLDLVGLEARLLGPGGDAGPAIGVVRNLLHGGNDLLEVQLNAAHGNRVVLIPFVEPIVPEVRLEEGWIGLTPPPGLLEL
jgi:16S rRNA processing protein RimM